MDQERKKDFLFHDQIPGGSKRRVKPPGEALNEEPLYGGKGFLELLVERAGNFSIAVVVQDQDICGEITAVLNLFDFFKESLEFRNAVFGLLEPGMLGIGFPGLKGEGALKFIRKIQERLKALKLSTVTAGIAEYPALNFSPAQVLENAKKAVDHATFFGPNSSVCFDSVSLNISGDKKYQEKDIKGAIAEYTLALKLDPLNVNVLNSLGVCYGVSGLMEKAMETFETASWIDPEDVMPVYNQGLVKLYSNEPEAALAFFEKAHRLNPDLFEVSLQLGRLYLRQGRPKRARKHLYDACRVGPDSYQASSALGECLFMLGENESAVQFLKKAVRINPNEAKILSLLGWLMYLQRDSLDVAEVFCRQSTEIEPENGLYHFRLAKLLLERRLFDEAAAAANKAVLLGFDAEELLSEITLARERREKASGTGDH